MPNVTFTVSNAAQLAAAIKLSRGGETINLNTGNYGSLLFYKFNPTEMVTIQANPVSGGIGSTAKPFFTGITSNLSSNLTFSGIEMSQTQAPTAYKTNAMFNINNSTNVNLLNMDFHGSLNNNPLGDMSALRVTSSNNIQIDNSKFHDLYNAAAFKNVSALSVTNTTTFDVREGFNFVGVHHVLFDHNLVYSVIADYVLDPTIPIANGEHPDMIQFWTVGAGPSDDVTISNNALLLGRGQDTHGIFISSTDGSLFSNFLIENNLISTNNAHGITLDNTVGAIIKNNTVLTSGGTNWMAMINLTETRDIQLTDNISTNYRMIATNTVTSSGNITVHTGGAMDATNVLSNFVNPLKLQTTSVADFAEIPGSLAATSGAGFDLAAFNASVPFATYDAIVHSLHNGGFLHHIA